MIKHKRKLRQRRGAVLVWVAVLLPVLLGIVGLSIDVGRLLIARAYLQAGSDMASLSGVIQLPDKDVARTAARDVLTANEPAAGGALEDGEMIFGTWDPPTRTFTPEAEPADAMMLTGSRNEDHSNPVPLFFLPILGESFADTHAVAIAYAAPRVGGWYSGGLIGGTAIIDGYDINDGPYGGANSGLPGSALSNGSMTVHGTPVVTGDARPGVTYTEATVNGNPDIGGTIAALTRPFDLAPVVIPTSISSGANDNNAVTGVQSNGNSFDPLPANNNLTVGSNRTGTMPSGNYYTNSFTVQGTLNITGPATIRVTGEWRITGQGRINLSGGPVQFFVEGNATLAGQGIVNTSQDPRNFTIYSTGDQVRWEGGSDFYGYIYGPFDPVVSIRGNNEFFGGAVGRVLEISGTGDIHTELGEGFDGPNRRLPILVD
jgi:hypothetical protein